jgi:hypothetical protein
MDGEQAQGEEPRMKKRPLPQATRSELKAEALKLLAGSKDPVEAVEYLLDMMTNWDIEEIIERLRNENNDRT